MPLAKLFRILDADGQAWFVAAPSFSMAVDTMRQWEGETEDPRVSDDSVVQSVTAVEDLIIGGTREDSLNDYQLIGYCPSLPPPTNWTDADRLAHAVGDLLDHLHPAPNGVDTKMDVWLARVKALREAYDIYTDIPF